jgi:mRNA interferase HigB
VLDGVFAKDGSGAVGFHPTRHLTALDVAEQYFAIQVGHKGVAAACKQYEAWRAIAEAADWRHPADVKKSHRKASIKSGRVVFNIKANDFRLICAMDYRAGIVMVRLFGSHAEYDQINAETV